MDMEYMQGTEVATGKKLYVKMVVSKHEKFGRRVLAYGFASDGDYLCILEGGEYKYLPPHEVRIKEKENNSKPSWNQLMEMERKSKCL
jgi:hypothetical protein